MPGIESKTNIQEINVESETEEQTPPTLTDHLNKKLLSSFLNRINTEGSNFSQMFTNVSDSATNGNNEEDFTS